MVASIGEPSRPPLYSIALLSATALAYEVLLVRLFSIIQWHHFAYMVISLALLGYGVSGTFLAFTQHWLRRHFATAYLANLLLFALSTLGCFLLAQAMEFNPEEILWDTGQWRRLLLVYLVLAAPFLFVANAIGLTLMHYAERLSRVYAADLIGAGAGSLGVILVLYLWFPLAALQVLGLLAVLGFLVAQWELGHRHPGWQVSGLGVALLIAVAPAHWASLTLSPYKSLSQMLLIPGAKILQERSSPLGLISVLESPEVPLRHGPGLSLHAGLEPPPQLGIFVDGEGPSVINALNPGDPRLGYLEQMTSALPYALSEPRQVLILGAGGGSEVLQARRYGAEQIDGVELDPQIVELVRDDYGSFAGDLYRQPGVRIQVAEARGFVAGTVEHYDLIQLALLDAFGATSAGLHALSEHYLYTVEALGEYLSRLRPDGMLAITRWIRMPPRDTLKLLATAATALEAEGVADPGSRMALIRSWQTSTLIIKNGAITPAQTEAIRAFCQARAFDLAYAPGIDPAETNRYNRLREPLFYQAATALLGPDRERFLEDYKYNLQPATDDRPYFFHFFRWRTLPEILELRGRGGTALLDVGYLVLLATLTQAAVVSLILILLPLALASACRRSADAAPSRWRVFVYFAALGLAFLFVEIAFIQKLILFLHHPLYAVAVVLTAFLVFAGLGSWYSQRRGRSPLATGIGWPVLGIAGLTLTYLVVLDPLLPVLSALPEPARILFGIGLIAPLAFLMGMPFPRGLSQLARHGPDLIPWAWAINGCASVISAGAATLVAIHFGFTVVVSLAVGLYGLAALSFPAAAATRHPPSS
jgi:hypothetical protein